MERRIFKLLLYFLVLFTANLVINVMFKDDLNILTAFSVALGVSWGIIYLSPYIRAKIGAD